MILIHELGHFWACLAMGVKVETFSIGFGPRLFGIRRGDTDYRVSAILFGGYVRMLGEVIGDARAASLQGGTDLRPSGAHHEIDNTLDPRSFQAKPRWKRAIVIIAGPLMNVLLAIAIVTGLYMYAYPKEVSTTDPLIASVAPGSAAAEAGIQPGDRIIQFGDKKNPDWDYVLEQEALNANHALTVVVNRHGKDIDLAVTPHMDPREGIGVVGWGGATPVEVGDVMPGSPAAEAGLKSGDVFLKVNGKSVASPIAVQQAVLHAVGRPIEFQLLRKGAVRDIWVAPKATGDPKMPWRIGINFKLPVQFVKLGFFPALNQSISFNRTNALMVFQVLGSLAERRVSPKSLTGPIGIAQMSSQAAQEGAWSYLLLMAFVSLQLAIFNLLPIPMLDGGTLLLLIIEMLLQREVSLQVKETVFKLGFVFLMMVVVFVIYNDISRILTKG